MDTLIGRSERVWVFLMIGFLCFGFFEVHGQSESNGTRSLALDLSKTETVGPEVTAKSAGRVLEVIKKVINYPLIKMGKGNLTLQSLLILGLLFILVIIAEKIVRERIIMRVFDKTDFPEALEYGIARILGYIFF